MEDANKVVQSRNVSIKDTINKYKKIADEQETKLKNNPYHESYKEPKFDKNSKDYGRPPPGSLTEARGIKASVHMCQELLFLLEMIDNNAEGEHPNRFIKFGRLFTMYSYYSEKLVGMMIRARKYGLITFEGEMLYQRQDDNKPVTMLMTVDQAKKSLKATGDPVNCVQIIRTD